MEHVEVLNERRRIDAEITKLEDRRKEIIDESVIKAVDEAIMKERIDRIKICKTELLVERGELRNSEEDKELLVDFAIGFIGDAANLWREEGLDNKQRFQKMVFPDGIDYDFDSGFGTARMSLIYEEIWLMEAEKQKQEALVGASLAQESTLVTHIESNWNLICEEILRWYGLLKGLQMPVPHPAGV